MKANSFCVLLLGFFSSWVPASAQLDFLQCTDTTFCVPAVSGLPRSKGVEIVRESFAPHDIRISGGDDGSASEMARIRQNERWSFKLRGPLVMKENFNLAMGFRFEFEEFNFENSEALEAPLLQQLEDRPLRSMGVGFYLSKPFRGNRYVIGRLQSDLNGDWNEGLGTWSDYLRVSAAAVYGIKVDYDQSFAIGLSYNYAFGQPTIIPVIAYFHSFRDKWGIEALLPARARLRFTPNASNNLYVGCELRGSNYLTELTDESLPLFLESSEIRGVFTYEREIHDWLWMGLNVGYRHYLGFDLSDSDGLVLKPRDPVLTTEVEDALLYSFSIFMVPPRRFFQ